MRTSLLTLIFLFSLASCTQNPKAPYPPDFVPLEPSQIRGEMALMNSYMHEIDQVLLDDTTISSEQQEKIIAILASIEEVADRLGADGTATGHLVIDMNIDHFRNDVDIALRGASANPPNYYPLGRLAGSCNACHRQR